MDEAGNAVYSPKFGTFTTASTVDPNPAHCEHYSHERRNQRGTEYADRPDLLEIHESLYHHFHFAGGVSGSTPVDVVDGMSISEDSRTIHSQPRRNAWTPGAVITIELTSAIQDLSGNPLANTTSHFS